MVNMKYCYLVNIGPDCQPILKIVDWFQVMSLIFNSSLFLFRVRAVFAHSRVIRFAFMTLWLTTFMALSIPFCSSLRDVTICNINDVKPLEAMGFIAVEVFDTAIFVAISVQVVRSSIADSRHDRLAVFVTGNRLGQVSKVLLQSGQLYYLSVLVRQKSLSVLTLPYSTGVPLGRTYSPCLLF